MTLLERLSAPFPPATVSWRVGATTQDKSKGMALAYIDARDVQDRLNEVCGHDWQVRHPWSTADGKIACEVGIKVDGEWIWRGDGAGNTDVEAEKGAFSDAFKRAAVRWGIGRYLYDIDSPWVELEQKGRSYVIAERAMNRLRSALTTRPTTAGSRSTPSGSPVGENVATRDATGNGSRDYARARFREIKAALEYSGTETNVHDVYDLSEKDRELIKEFHLPSYQKLETLRDEMLAKLRQPSVDVLNAMRTGSAPELMGEP